MSLDHASKSRPILFSDPMVRALLAGKKTMTRRGVKPQPSEVDAKSVEVVCNGEVHYRRPPDHPLIAQARETPGYSIRSFLDGLKDRCPFGRPGDRLWVREAVWCWSNEPRGRNGGMLWPKFTDESAARRWFDRSCEYVADHKARFDPGEGGALNKMFMPRWASRIALEITDVRVERLNEISEADALAEGIRTFTKDGRLNKYWACDPHDDHPPKSLRTTWQDMPRSSVDAYRALWQSLHGSGPNSWDANPFVWAITLRVLTQEEVQS